MKIDLKTGLSYSDARQAKRKEMKEAREVRADMFAARNLLPSRRLNRVIELACLTHEYRRLPFLRGMIRSDLRAIKRGV